MNHSEIQLLVDEIADDFVLRRRNGESPTVEEYVSAHPAIAEPIREALKTIQFVNNIKNESVVDLPPVSPSTDSTAFPNIDDYEIVREIGRGGMGVVYEAHQLSLNRSVALKILPTVHFHSAAAVDRFQLEARSAAGLHHSNIVPVFEVGVTNEQCFYTMQYIDGQSLDFIAKDLKGLVNETDAPASQSGSMAATLRMGQSSTSAGSRPFYRNIARIGQQVANALQYAHDHGIIHRDIKPANLMLDNQGIVWVTDFGLAKTQDSELTRTGDVVGTLRYMSPERFAGHCDYSSDVYSLGMTLYELLGLKPAFEDTNRLSLIDSIKNESPKPLDLLDRKIPRDLQTIVEKSMAKESRRRYSNAGEMASDLGRFINGQPIHARRVSQMEKLLLWAKKRKALAASLAALTLVLITSLVGSMIAAIYFRDMGIRQTELAEKNLSLAVDNEKKKVVAEQKRDEAYQSAYYADMQLAQQDWNSGQIRRMLETLRRYVPAYPEQEIRNWEWFYLLSLANQDRRTIYGHEGGVLQTRWSRDGKRIFSGSKDQTLRIWSAVDGTELQKISIPNLKRFSVSPDGTSIATASGDSVIRYWDTLTGKLIRAVRTELTAIEQIEWSENSNRIVVCSSNQDETPKVFDSETDQLIYSLPVPGQRWAKLSDDGKRLATFRSYENKIWDVDAGKVINQLADEEGRLDSQIHSFDWHSDGEHFVTGSFMSGGRIYQIEPNAVCAKRLTRFHTKASIEAVEFSADGKFVLTSDRSQMVEVYEFESMERVEQFKGHLGWVNTADWHPTDGTVVSGALDGTIKIWQTMASKTIDEETESESKMVTTRPVRRPESTGRDDRFTWTHDKKSMSVTIHERRSGNKVLEYAEVNDQDPVYFLPEIDRVIVKDFPNNVAVWDTTKWNEKPDDFVDATRGVSGYFMDWGGKYLAASSGLGMMEVVDLETFSSRRIKVNDQYKVGLAMRRDGGQIATIGYGPVKIFDSESGKETATLFGHAPGRWLSAVIFSNNGHLLATTGWDQKVIIWDLSNYEIKHAMTGHQSVPRTLYFSKDDSRVMSIGKYVKIWDVATGREVLSFERATMPATDQFRTLASAEGFELDESVLRFKSLDTLEAVSSTDGKLGHYPNETMLTLARQILFGSDASELDIERSLNLAQSTVDFEPTALRSLTTLAYAQIRNHKNDLALANNKLALATEPKDVESQLLQVILLAGSGEMDSAIELFGKIVADRSTIKLPLLMKDAASIEDAQRAHQDSRGERATISDYSDRLFLHASTELFPQRKNTESRSPIKVTTLKDELDGPGTNGCSLREALLAARPNDSIEFDVNGTMKLTLGALMINKSVNLIGPGVENLTIDADGRSRVFYINDGTVGPDAKVKISGMKLVGGRAYKNSADAPTNRGGGIYSRENLTIEDCVLENHFALRGGALWVDHGSTTKINRCTFEKNKCTNTGGAIASCGNKFGDRTILNISNSMFTQNVADLVGGAIGTYGHLNIVNSTIHANIASSASEGGKWNGGGIACIDAYSDVELNHCTITDNAGGGISFNRHDPNVFVGRNFTSPIRNKVRNCIIFGNTKQDTVWDAGHYRTSSCDVVNVSHSLIGSGQGMIYKGGNLIGEDPKLLPLSNNGGRTQTRKIDSNSPCRDKGSLTGISKDQRGRPRDNAPDMGACEFEQ